MPKELQQECYRLKPSWRNETESAVLPAEKKDNVLRWYDSGILTHLKDIFSAVRMLRASLLRSREEGNVLSMWCGAGTDLQRSGDVRISGLTEPLLWFGVHAFPALPQDHVNLYVHQQGDDEGNVEGHDGGVHHEGRISDDTEGLVTSGCEEE